MSSFSMLKYSITILLIFSSCKKFLDVGLPPDKVASEFVYNSNTSAAAVLTGLYFDLQGEADGFAQGRSGVSLFMGLAADEFNTLPLSVYADFYRNNAYYDFWSRIYKMIYRTNAAIEGLSSSSSLSEVLKNQLIGESKFLRAFLYFYLVNLYGDVPLLISSDYKVNSKTGKTPMDKVYEQIISDLLDAEKLLRENYADFDAIGSSLDRIRPNKYSASALLARVYLYVGKWSQAEDKASLLIAQKALYDTAALNDVFNKNSKEAIWQLQSVSDGVQLNTLDAGVFTFTSIRPDEYFNPIWLSDDLKNSFEPGDERCVNWTREVEDTLTKVKYRFFTKYKKYLAGEEYLENVMVLRLGEQFLVRAEARAQQDKIEKALEDLNIIRQRARLPVINLSSKTLLLESILREKQVELCSEWGHRWFDLKRTGRLDDIMTDACIKKGGIWEPYKKLMPIPMDDLKYNLNLTQNEGYPSN